MGDIARRALTVVVTLFVIVMVMVVLLWTHGFLFEWRKLPLHTVAEWLWRYFVTVSVTILCYRFAAALVGLNAAELTRSRKIWLYSRWALFTGIAAWLFSLFGDKVANGVTAIKGFVALLVVGLIGTRAGIIENERKLRQFLKENDEEVPQKGHTNDQ
ncbi:MAG TPA: hypothetical protein VJ810_31160 [Blastocatellia bacterium]|nr:hypothetical protein [Blastocatellia bacterium]